MMRKAILLGTLLLAAGSASALVQPHAGPGDPLMRWVHYDPDQVVDLHGNLGFQFTIQFGEEERIENVSIGDGLGWQVTPNHRANALFMKPMQASATTNMTVLTNMRRYNFVLHVLPRGANTELFGLRFEYPVPALAVPVVLDPVKAAPPPPADKNHAYTYSGSRQNVPDRLFDDGHSTYFSFNGATDYPAIFISTGPKKEVMATTSVRNGYVVVDQIAESFVLRRGDEVTTIVNDGYVAPVLGPLAPRPRGKK